MTTYFDPAQNPQGLTLDKDNRRVKQTTGAGYDSIRCFHPILSGEKKYFTLQMDGNDPGDQYESGYTAGGTIAFGYVNTVWTPGADFVGADANSMGWVSANGQRYINGAGSTTGDVGAVFTYAGTRITIVMDRVSNVVYVGRNGAFHSPFAPLAGTGGYAITLTGDLYPAAAINTANARCRIVPFNYPGLDALGFSELSVPATITFAAGSIKDEAGANVTESGVVAIICDRATGNEIAVTTANISGGAATLAFDADVTNGQTVVVHFHSASGTFKSYGNLAAVSV